MWSAGIWYEYHRFDGIVAPVPPLAGPESGDVVIHRAKSRLWRQTSCRRNSSHTCHHALDQTRVRGASNPPGLVAGRRLKPAALYCDFGIFVPASLLSDQSK